MNVVLMTGKLSIVSNGEKYDYKQVLQLNKLFLANSLLHDYNNDYWLKINFILRNNVHWLV